MIDLGLDDSGNLTFGEKGKADKDYTAGGYAQGKLWGFCNISSERKLYPFNAETFTASGDPFTTGKNNVRDLTGAPATTVTYTKDGSKQTVTDPASLLYVTSKADLGRLGLFLTATDLSMLPISIMNPLLVTMKVTTHSHSPQSPMWAI